MDSTRRRRRPPRPRRLSVLLLLMCAALLLRSAAAAAADIDSGFVQDGKTTYCQGVHRVMGPLVFEELTSSSAGKCPIDVQISVAATTVAPLTPLAVSWAASIHRGALATNLFPHAVAASTKTARNVIASLLRACKAGSNCVAAGSVVEPALAAGARATDAGAFDVTGTKALPAFQFQFPTAGEDFVIVAKVVLPGDSALNISATEFVAFQRITVGTTTTPTTTTTTPPPTTTSPPPAATTAVPTTTAPGTVKPSEIEGLHFLNVATTPTPTAAAASSSPVTAAPVTASSGASANMQTVAIIGVAGIVIVLLVVGYAVIVIKEKRKLEAMPQATATARQPPATANAHGGRTLHRGMLSMGQSRLDESRGPGGLGGPGGAVGGFGIMLGGGFSGRGMHASAAGAGSGDRRMPHDKPFPPVPARQSSMSSRRSSMGMATAFSKNVAAKRAPPPPPPAHRPPSWIQVPKHEQHHSTDLLPPRLTRAVSTESTGFSDSSSFSLGGASISSSELSGATDSTKQFHIHEVSQRSTVALLEASACSSDLSSLGSLHDSAEQIPIISQRARNTQPTRVTRGSSMIMLDSFRDEDDDGMMNTFYRPSSRLHGETAATAKPKPRSLERQSTLDRGLSYPRDTSEYDAPFSARHSEFESDRERPTNDGHGHGHDPHQQQHHQQRRS